MAPETQPRVELNNEEVLSATQAWIEEIFSRKSADLEVKKRHLFLTESWVQKIDPEAVFTVRMAALTHEVDCSFLPVDASPYHLDSEFSPDSYGQSRIESSKHSAKIVGEFLRRLGVARKDRRRIRTLIRCHVTHSWHEFSLIRAADSLSFLEVEAPFLIDSIPQGLKGSEIEWLLARMYHRIGFLAAEKEAEQLYLHAMAQLQKRRKEARKRYWQLTSQRKGVFRSASKEEIASLQEAADLVLALG